MDTGQVIVGIDEAGYGPLLGPLVLTAASLLSHTDIPPRDLWDLLHASVARQCRGLRGRLLITDSKKAFHRRTGLGHLERTVLSVVDPEARNIHSLADLLRCLCPHSLARLAAYPWYEDLAAVPLPVDDPDKAVAGAAWRRDLERHDLRPGPLVATCLDVGTYNHQVTATRNKASVLFTAACGLIQQVLRATHAPLLRITVDRQGGRTHYRTPLLRMFPEWALTIREESETTSRYCLAAGQRRLDLTFRVHADRDCLPVSLASMVSKYLRECLVARINHHFRQACPDLTPTAGYWQDGRRFLRDLKQKCPQVPFAHERLVRSR